jgi:hypothetical protein
MNKSLTSLLLLVVLGITDAYLLSHPNLIGKLGIFIYKHDYLKTFPRALATVFLVLGVSLLICEVITRKATTRNAIAAYLIFMTAGLGLFVYVYSTFSSVSYSMTGKSFIYGAHLLPVLLIGIFGRYFVMIISNSRN